MPTEFVNNDKFWIPSLYTNGNWSNHGVSFSFRTFLKFEQCEKFKVWRMFDSNRNLWMIEVCAGAHGSNLGCSQFNFLCRCWTWNMATIATISEKRCEKSQPHAVRHALLHKKAKPFLKVTLRILPKKIKIDYWIEI